MNSKLLFLTCLFVFLHFHDIIAQNFCNYRIELFDSFGDGWDGASVDITTGENTFNVTINQDDNNGDFNIIEFPVVEGDFISIIYNEGIFESEHTYTLFNSENIIIFQDGPNPTVGVVFEAPIDCLTCPVVDILSVFSTPTTGGADILWTPSPNSNSYILEYGEVGFEFGTGTAVATSNNSYSLSNQVENTFIDLYIQADCGAGDISLPIGPILVFTGSSTPPLECTYILNMQDSFGDGWNGASIDLTVNGVTTNFTIDFSDNNGDFNIVEIPVIGNSILTLSYSGGTFESENSYTLIDAMGNIIWSDGPNPQQGEAIFETITNCPACPLPMISSLTTTINDINSATISWNEVSPANTYIIEYGLGCFAQGEGEVLTTTADSIVLEELIPNMLYSYYFQVECGVDGLSVSGGPFFFQIDDFCEAPFNPVVQFVDATFASILWVPAPETEEYIIEYGWAGFALGGGWTTEPIDGNFKTIQDLSPNTSYDFYIYGSCDTEFSNALGPYNFITGASCPMISNFGVDTIIGQVAYLNWNTSSGVNSYSIEYGHSGFEQGTGQVQTVTESPYEITNLNPDVLYDVYVFSNCAEVESLPAGPFSISTPPPIGNIGTNGEPCVYRLEMFDTFGDGWNGSFLIITRGGMTEEFTIAPDDNNGDFNIVDLVVVSGEELIVSYIPGAFENENSYTLLDSEGNILLQDGPNPTVGEVLNTISVCPLCTSITLGTVGEVFENQASISWSISNNAENYTIEIGEVGFELGTGESYSSVSPFYTLSDLVANTWYNVYITPFCGVLDGEGRSYGPLVFKTRSGNDVGLLEVVPPTDLNCILDFEPIYVTLQNYGNNPQSFINVHCSYRFMNENTATEITNSYVGVLGYNETAIVDLGEQLNLSQAGTYSIDIWTELENDEDLSNDTISFEIETSALLPFYEDFEASSQATGLPAGWSSNMEPFAPILEPGLGQEHGLLNNAIGIEFNFISEFNFRTHRLGPIQAESILTFDYRAVMVDNQGNVLPYEFDEDDQIKVDVSTDCGATFETIYTLLAENIQPSLFYKKVEIPLGEYADESIVIQLDVMNENSGNFIINFDNFDIRGCPSSLFIQADASSSFSFQQENGYIFANPTYGEAPFSFEWSNGETTSFIDELSLGSYTLTITDASGCSDFQTFDITSVHTQDFPISNFEELILAPNPANGNTQLKVSLSQEADIFVELYDAAGRVVLNKKQNYKSSAVFDLDLSGQIPGFYFIKVKAKEEARVLKLVVE